MTNYYKFLTPYMKNIQQKVEEFDKKFGDVYEIISYNNENLISDDIKSFISQALQDQRAEIVKEIIKLEKNQGGIQSNIIVTSKEDDIYNNALRAVLTLLSDFNNQEL